MLSLKRIHILNNLGLKLLSLMLGLALWFLLSNSVTINRWLEVPLCFYNVPPRCRIQAPESVTVQVACRRADLLNLSLEHLALHIDVSKLRDGLSPVSVAHESLFLPKHIKLVNWTPCNIVVDIHRST